MDDIAASTPEETPEKRAERGYRTIEAFYEGKVPKWDTMGDIASSLGDLLTDLMHWSEARGADFAAALTQAEHHYEAERDDEPCEHYGSWRVWEDTIYDRHVHVVLGADGKPAELRIGHGSVGDGDNDRIFCADCMRVFPFPDEAEVDYV